MEEYQDIVSNHYAKAYADRGKMTSDQLIAAHQKYVAGEWSSKQIAECYGFSHRNSVITAFKRAKAKGIIS